MAHRAYYVSYGQVSNGINLCYYDSMYVYSGGTANSTTVDWIGYLHVSDGGVVNLTTVDNSGCMYVYSGGMANSTIVNANCYLYVSSGGVVNSTTMKYIASMYVCNGGTANKTAVSGGYLYVSSGGVANSTAVEEFGYLYVYNGGVANETSVSGNMYVSSGGVANETSVNYWSDNLYVANGGTANKTIINGGSTHIFSGGVANETTMSSGGMLYVSNGGVVNKTTVSGNALGVGNLFVSNGGVANKTTVSGWYAAMYVSSGGVANSTTVSGGGMHVYAGGVASKTILRGGCEWYESAVMYVSNGGVANSTTVNSGGILCVSSGGKATGTLFIVTGATVSAYTKSFIDFDVSNVAPGDAARLNALSRISGAPDFTVTVSATQTAGKYKLAEGAASFDKSVTVVTSSGAELGNLSVGGEIISGDYTYRLGLEENLLSLTVESAVSGLATGDLNGDGRADIVMSINQATHPADGSTGAWLIQDTQTATWGDLSQRNSGWSIFGTGVTSVGKTTNDIYVKSSDNVVGAWVTNDAGAVTGWETVGQFDGSTNVLGLGDFNGDGQTDLLLRNDNGAVGCYFTSGDKLGWNYFQSLGDEWTVAAVGDLNGDGRDDVVLKHDAGFAGSWLTQSDYTMAWANLDTLADGFEIVGCGDFDGDGTSDVLLKKGSYYGAWIVEDGSVSSWMGLGELGGVTVEEIADFDADGIDDLRVRTSAGDLGAQLVKGADTLEWHYYGSVGPEWSTSLTAI